MDQRARDLIQMGEALFARPSAYVPVSGADGAASPFRDAN